MPKLERVTDLRKPRLIVALGRGRTGKTVFLSWLTETAQRDIPLRILDADVNNPVLSERYKGAEIPSGTEEDRRIWLEKQIGGQMEAAMTDQRHDILLDLGGGDLLVKQWGRDLGLASLLEQASIDVVAVHLLGPEKADLAYLEDIEARKLFCPEKTILLLNEGLVKRGRSSENVFHEVIDAACVRQVVNRGGKVAVMPRLDCMEMLEKHNLRFRQAIEPGTTLGPFDRVRVRRWLDVDMPAMRAELGDWIG